uniref:Uncharacterized protein n=1 Tax=Arundo donax TaxID=35708 RepID=A0A0A9ET86_ARUDO
MQASSFRTCYCKNNVLCVPSTQLIDRRTA